MVSAKSHLEVEERKALAHRLGAEYNYRLGTGDPPELAMERVIEELGLVDGQSTCPECGEELS